MSCNGEFCNPQLCTAIRYQRNGIRLTGSHSVGDAIRQGSCRMVIHLPVRKLSCNCFYTNRRIPDIPRIRSYFIRHNHLILIRYFFFFAFNKRIIPSRAGSNLEIIISMPFSVFAFKLFFRPGFIHLQCIDQRASLNACRAFIPV